MCLDENVVMVPQSAQGTYAASKAQCTDCKGVGERLKEKERQVFLILHEALGSPLGSSTGVKNVKEEESSKKRHGKKYLSKEG